MSKIPLPATRRKSGFLHSLPTPAALALCLAGTFAGCAAAERENALDHPSAPAGAGFPMRALPGGGFHRAETTPTRAATEVTSGPLSLEQVIELAYRVNPTFHEFAARRDAARAALVEAVAFANPDFEIEYGYVTSRDKPGSRGDSYGVKLEQPLEAPSKRRARRAVAELETELSDTEREAFRVQLRGDVAHAYATLLYRERALGLARKMADLAEQALDMTKRRIDTGEAPPIDLAKSRIETLLARRQVRAETRKRDTARIVLNTLCGEALPDGFVPAEALRPAPSRADGATTESGIPDSPDRPDPSDLVRKARIDRALETHPDLARLDVERRRAARELDRQRAEALPDWRPGIGFVREPGEDTVGVSLGLTLPLWNGNRGAIERARAELDRIDAEIESARNRIRGRIETALQDHASAREQLDSLRELRVFADEVLKKETFLYRQGETDFLSFLEARRTYQSTFWEYMRTEYDIAIAETDLVAALGISTPEGLEP